MLGVVKQVAVIERVHGEHAHGNTAADEAE
jgi:hypothetical protein